MDDTLITRHDLRFPWRAVLRALSLGLLAGAAAFTITWCVLAWSTIQMELAWYFGTHDAPTLQTASGQSTPSIAENRLVIPLITVNAPVIYDTQYIDAVGTLPDGVVHVRGTAYPGEVGNTFLIGHSSGYWWQQGKYNQVFVLLSKLKPGDQVLINRNNITFEYRVTGSEVVPPSRIDVLNQPTDRSELSLMTCTPVGTSLNRLIVHAQLVENR